MITAVLGVSFWPCNTKATQVGNGQGSLPEGFGYVSAKGRGYTSRRTRGLGSNGIPAIHRKFGRILGLCPIWQARLGKKPCDANTSVPHLSCPTRVTIFKDNWVFKLEPMSSVVHLENMPQMQNAYHERQATPPGVMERGALDSIESRQHAHRSRRNHRRYEENTRDSPWPRTTA